MIDDLLVVHEQFKQQEIFEIFQSLITKTKIKSGSVKMIYCIFIIIIIVIVFIITTIVYFICIPLFYQRGIYMPYIVYKARSVLW